jgi:hypothetical protein
VVKGLYVSFDKVAKQANPPFLANNDPHALRLQAYSLNEAPADMRNDIVLYCIGYFDEHSMVNDGEEGPRLVELDMNSPLDDSTEQFAEKAGNGV